MSRKRAAADEEDRGQRAHKQTDRGLNRHSLDQHRGDLTLEIISADEKVGRSSGTEHMCGSLGYEAFSLSLMPLPPRFGYCLLLLLDLQFGLG